MKDYSFAYIGYPVKDEITFDTILKTFELFYHIAGINRSSKTIEDLKGYVESSESFLEDTIHDDFFVFAKSLYEKNKENEGNIFINQSGVKLKEGLDSLEVRTIREGLEKQIPGCVVYFLDR